MSNGSQPGTQLRTPIHLTVSKTTFHFFAGLSSGLTSSILLQPADLLKTRVQQSRSTSLLPTLRAILSGPSPILSLWRGTLPSALRTGLGSALYFTSLNALRQSVAKTSITTTTTTTTQNVPPSNHSSSSSALPKLSHIQNLTTGAIARTVAGFIMMPVTVLKVRYESSYYNYRSLWGASKDILAKEGPRGFFVGFGATAVRDAPYAGLYVVFYEAAKKRLGALRDAAVTAAAAAATTATATASSSSSKEEAGGSTSLPAPRFTTISSSTSINFLSGLIAAGTATALTNPFDAVKTRLQLQPSKYRNMIAATKIMLREDGVRSLFDGLGLRMARKAISSALAWSVYEELISRAERGWRERDGL